MLRLFASLFCLVICLNVLVDLAGQPLALAEEPSRLIGSPIEDDRTPGNEEPAAEPVVSPITPYQESAWLSSSAKLEGFLSQPLLITMEPALVQLQVEHVVHERWQQLGVAPKAPFTFSRTLPLQI